MRLIYLLVLAGILVSCQGQPRLVHAVTFEPGHTVLVAREFHQVNLFVASLPNQCVEIDGPRSGGGYFDPVTAARVAEIMSHVGNVGFQAEVPREPFWADMTNAPSILMRAC